VTTGPNHALNHSKRLVVLWWTTSVYCSVVRRSLTFPASSSSSRSLVPHADADDPALRGPVRHPQPAARTQHAHQLIRRGLLIRREHRAEGRGHHVEAGVGERQGPGLGQPGLQRKTFGRSPLDGMPRQVGARDVEDLLAGVDMQVPDQQLADHQLRDTDPVEVTGTFVGRRGELGP
jgi:hypothetical protein